MRNWWHTQRVHRWMSAALVTGLILLGEGFVNLGEESRAAERDQARETSLDSAIRLTQDVLVDRALQSVLTLPPTAGTRAEDDANALLLNPRDEQLPPVDPLLDTGGGLLTLSADATTRIPPTAGETDDDDEGGGGGKGKPKGGKGGKGKGGGGD